MTELHESTPTAPAAASAASAAPAAPAAPAGGGLLSRLRPRGGVWAERDFVRLWAGQSVSQLGSQVTLVALPLVAINTLHAGAGAMGLLNALGRLPFLLYFVAGVWVDRTRRRGVLIGTDIGRGLLLLTIPAALALHLLAFWYLGVLMVAAMVLSVWFDIAYMSYLPSLVSRDRLMQGNTVLETSRSAGQILGPSLGGVLVSVLTAPVAVIVDAVSYFASAFSVWRIRSREPAPEAGQGGGVRGIADAVREGFRFVARDHILAPLALAIGVSNLVWAAEGALYLLYLAKGVGLSAWLIGLVMAASGPGTLVGSALAGQVARRAGVSSAIAGGLGVFAASALLIPIAPHVTAVAVPMLMVSGFGMAAGGQVCSINVLTTRQSITPDRLLGRVNASFRFMALGVSPLGALGGGLLGAVIGIRGAVLVSVLGMFAPPLIVLLSPVRGVRRIPDRSAA